MTSSADPRDEFLSEVAAAIGDGSFEKMTLGKPRGSDSTVRNVFIRPVQLRGELQYSFLWRHETRDVTKNHTAAATLAELRKLIGTDFHSAHLFTPRRTTQLEYNKKGEPRLTSGRAASAESPRVHDHAKERLLTPESRGWMQALGLINHSGVVREGMADKHRQIHKFVELLSHLVQDADLPTDRPLAIVDMGCGKGYLTFATHDYFNLVAHHPATVLGIEFRPELVELCNRIARDTARPQLSFTAGTIEDVKLGPTDVLIALHACDTATDDALARGITAGATMLVVSPCCQKELRPQLRPSPVLAQALRHGIFQERHAEFATDALRALLLEWAGYDTKVFEFISTEHTAKNLMIAATRRTRQDDSATRERRAREICALASFYGIASHALARHLGFSLPTPTVIPSLPS